MKTIDLDFDGYWREINKDNIDNQSGIYCVYTCVYNPLKKNVSIKKLLYIGESSNVHDRIANHNKLPLWKTYLSDGETLCYTFAPVDSKDRERAEAALIYKHQPPTNEEHMNHFIYEGTTMHLCGKIAKLSEKFVVKRTL